MAESIGNVVPRTNKTGMNNENSNNNENTEIPATVHHILPVENITPAPDVAGNDLLPTFNGQTRPFIVTASNNNDEVISTITMMTPLAPSTLPTQYHGNDTAAVKPIDDNSATATTAITLEDGSAYPDSGIVDNHGVDVSNDSNTPMTKVHDSNEIMTNIDISGHPDMVYNRSFDVNDIGPAYKDQVRDTMKTPTSADNSAGLDVPDIFVADAVPVGQPWTSMIISNKNSSAYIILIVLFVVIASIVIGGMCGATNVCSSSGTSNNLNVTTTAPTPMYIRSPSSPVAAPSNNSFVPCGDSNVGNGICHNTALCCSTSGYCGSTDAYCSREFCGNGKTGNTLCLDQNLCCSVHGYCGSTYEYCNKTATLSPSSSPSP